LPPAGTEQTGDPGVARTEQTGDPGVAQKAEGHVAGSVADPQAAAGALGPAALELPAEDDPDVIETCLIPRIWIRSSGSVVLLVRGLQLARAG
jgi:hypothetical protein